MPEKMKFVNLGETGLRVSRVCVGCMSYGEQKGRWTWVLPEEESLKVLDYCYKKGLNFYDTANVYSEGVSEEILGKAIKKFGWRRENLVIATKVFAPVARDFAVLSANEEERDNDGYVNMYGLSRKHIFESVDASLKRLDLPYIDLLQIHRFDPHTPPKETMKALHDVIQSGKVRYIGASSMWAHQLLEYQVSISSSEIFSSLIWRLVYCSYEWLDRIYLDAEPVQCLLPRRRKGNVSIMPEVRHGRDSMVSSSNGILNTTLEVF